MRVAASRERMAMVRALAKARESTAVDCNNDPLEWQPLSQRYLKASAKLKAFVVRLASSRKPPAVRDGEEACHLMWCADVLQH